MTQPDPMTPPECDLRGMPFMPLDVVRLGDSDLFALSTGDEFKAAVTLWCKSWLQVPAGSLPTDDRILAHLSMAGAAWRKVKDMALRGWVECSDGRLYHPVVAEKAREAWRHRQMQRERAAKRWDKERGKATAPAGGTPAADAAEPAAEHPAAHAAASPAAMQGTGTVKEEGTGADAPDAAASPAPPSARDLLWSAGVPILQHMTGKPRGACANIVGKLLRDARDDCPKVLGALQEAQELKPFDLMPWLTRAVQARTGAGQTQSGPSRVDLENEELMRMARGGQPTTVNPSFFDQPRRLN